MASEDLYAPSERDAPRVPDWLFYLTLASVGLLLVAAALFLWQRSAVAMSLAGGFLKYCF